MRKLAHGFIKLPLSVQLVWLIIGIVGISVVLLGLIGPAIFLISPFM